MVFVMKRLAILGSTGSIGRQTLEVVRAFPDSLDVVGLACKNNLSLLREQVAEFSPSMVCPDLGAANSRSEQTRYLPFEEIASHPEVDLVVIAT